MTTRNEGTGAVVQPRGLNCAQAARYVGVSQSLFSRMVAEAILPAARKIGQRLVWDLRELDQAFDELPHAGHIAQQAGGGQQHQDPGLVEDFV